VALPKSYDTEIGVNVKQKMVRCQSSRKMPLGLPLLAAGRRLDVENDGFDPTTG
jgi:hypothetical protein